MSLAHEHEINKHYINQIKKLPILSNEEEYMLAKQWRDSQDSKAIEALLNSHLRLVAKIASGYRGYGLPLSDLIAEGNLGMMQAMKHYDPEKGFRFSTYAMWWIKASMQEYILQSWSLVKIGTTRAQKKLFFSLKKTHAKLNQDTPNEDGLSIEKIKAIAAKLSVKEEEVEQMHQRLGARDNSLNVPIGNQDEKATEWIEWITDENDNQEIKIIQADEMKKRRTLFKDALACLNQREHIILYDRRLKEPPLTLEEISSKLKISRERVRQIENTAFDKLRKQIKRHATSHYHHI
ncbi:MAG: RNA polymerase sigma factor RpoH [Alphaproteobacteria bacterium]|nr:RNA polymerase sigma factor RpoH [Alphaproteobacteria bacterium]